MLRRFARSQRGHIDAREVRAWPIARLLDYSAPLRTAAVPTLVLPPQAGHASSIVDYGRDQSQMMTLRDGGLDRLFAIDWLPATDETADWSIEEYVAVLEEAVQFLGGRVNLVGDCQGGWLALVYAGLHPDQVNTLIIGGAPIDTHAGPVRDPGMDSTARPAQRTRGSTGHWCVGGGRAAREEPTCRVQVAGAGR